MSENILISTAQSVLKVAEAAETAVRVVIMPIDVVALVNVVLSGSAAILSAAATAYAVVSAIRSKRAVSVAENVQADVGVIKEDVGKLHIATNSLVKKAEDAARAQGIKEATAAGEAKAATLKQGQDEGRGLAGSATLSNKEGRAPVPVEDDRVATAAEKSADALQASADAQKKIAAVAEHREAKKEE